MMKVIRSYLFKPVIPVIFIRGAISQYKSQQILNQLDNKILSNAKALAIVIDSRSGLPAKTDLIANRLKIMANKHNLPIYGFAQSFCTASPYYLLSISNKIYSHKNSLIGFSADVHWMGLKNVINKFGVETRSVTSQQGMLLDTIDIFSDKSKQKVNSIYENMQTKLTQLSILNRKNKLTKEIERDVWYNGQQAIKLGLVDEIGSYNSVLQKQFPQCDIKPIHYSNFLEKIQRWVRFFTSPALLFLIFVLFIKATIKWSLIMYLWLHSKHSRQQKKLQGQKKQ